ncbi:hypothetical protein AK812_SmicGene13079 [Symbiodinium microadriaticum]|uniref:Uncharacterized protein n=1 Tax=Symbiodinium microadriaticum TaxID=2951 RepID=A0A1Q9E8Z9_SYMMI|nr:hypothetical protein AK812_SmicGene13079 [Symbiodinium microadriaticum]
MFIMSELKVLVEGLLALQPLERFSIDEASSHSWLDGDGTVTHTLFGSLVPFKAKDYQDPDSIFVQAQGDGAVHKDVDSALLAGIHQSWV